MNVVFYDVLGDTLAHMMGEIGWFDSCGSQHFLFFFDEQHDGQDVWQLQERNWEDNFQFPSCAGIRYHLRQYLSLAPAGDSHSPTFNGYGGMPVHWENANHESVNPTHGQDWLLTELTGNHHIVDSHTVEVLNSPFDCTWFLNWDGSIDLYEVSGEDPGGGETNCDTVTVQEFGGDGAPWMQFTCSRTPGPDTIVIEFP